MPSNLPPGCTELDEQWKRLIKGCHCKKRIQMIEAVGIERGMIGLPKLDNLKRESEND